MPKTSKEIGSWLLKNENLKGTPDFDFAVNQFKQARERENNPYLNKNNVYTTPQNTSDKSGLGDAMKNTDLRMREGSLGFISDVREVSKDGWLQKGLDNLGKKTDKFLDPIRGFVGVDTGAELREDRVVTEDAEIADTRKTAEEMKKQRDDLNYKGWSYKDVKGVGDVLPYALNKIVESIPYIAVGTAAGPALGTSMLMGVIMPGELNPVLKEIEGLPVKTRLKLAATGGALMGALERVGLGYMFKGVSKSIIGALDTKGIAVILNMRGVATNVIKNFVQGAVVESGTEFSQEVVSMGTEVLGGGDITKAQAKDRMLEAAIAGFTVGGSISSSAGLTSDVIKKAANNRSPYEVTEDGSLKLKSQKDLTPLEAKAYTSLAGIFKRLADEGDMDGTPFDLMDINPESKKGAKIVLDNAHSELVLEMNKMFKNNLSNILKF